MTCKHVPTSHMTKTSYCKEKAWDNRKEKELCDPTTCHEGKGINFWNKGEILFSKSLYKRSSRRRPEAVNSLQLISVYILVFVLRF